MTKNFDKIKSFLEEKTNRLNEESFLCADLENKAPCKVCGTSGYVTLYRNVVGEISGKIQGCYSLFGGSISGWIDGYTKTLPVLSCRNCHNEKLVATYDYKFPYEVFIQDMKNFCFGFKIDQFYYDNALETYKYAKENADLLGYVKEILFWTPESWEAGGFKIESKDLWPTKSKAQIQQEQFKFQVIMLFAFLFGLAALVLLCLVRL